MFKKILNDLCIYFILYDKISLLNSFYHSKNIVSKCCISTSISIKATPHEINVKDTCLFQEKIVKI